MTLEEIVGDEVEARAVALILVDCVNAYYAPDGPYHHAEVDRTAEPIARLIAAAREGRTLIVHAVERHRPGLDDFEYRVFEPHFWDGSPEAEIFPAFAPQGQLEIVLPRRRYSAFMATDLLLLLREQGVRQVVIAGQKTNIAVRATAEDAFSNGFFVAVPREAVSTDRPHLGEASLEDIEIAVGRVVSIDEACAIL
jgi:maleamate amidohydrolase